MQGGTAGEDIAHTLGLAAIYFEPLWILHTESTRPKLLNDLRSKRIAVGEAGSGSYDLAVKLLAEYRPTQNS